VLRPIQETFRQVEFPDLVLGLSTPDDAAVWRLDDSMALVLTTDFFTPVVDDAYQYGAIAAANALSDLYAMGATPFLALNIAAMPADLEAEIVQEILRGGAEKVRQAGGVVAGGHTIQDKEPKYGLVAAGMVTLASLMSKAGARPGDALVLTKPLGTGVTTTALKRGLARPEDVSEAVEWMQALNREASQVALRYAVHGATDVTGYGLLGHAHEMARTSGVGLELHAPDIPLLSGALGYSQAGIFPGGTLDNHTYFGPAVEFEADLPLPWQMLLFDAQTSGGLLLSVPPDSLPALLASLQTAGTGGWQIGWVTPGSGIRVLRAPVRPA